MRTIYLLALTALLFSCKKDSLPAPEPEETEHVLSSAPTDDLPSNPDETPAGIPVTTGIRTSLYFSFRDAGDGEIIKPKVIVNVWLTDTLDSENWKKKFDQETAQGITNRLNNKASYYYHRPVNRKIYIDCINCDRNSEVRRLLQHNKIALCEFYFVPVPNGYVTNVPNAYNWQYKSFIHRKGKPFQHYMVSVDAFRAGL